MNDIEKIMTKCCRRFCKTDQMNDEEFDNHGATVCTDCPLYDLRDYYENRFSEINDRIADIEGIIKTIHG